jgi:hypothetical protein
MPPTFVALGSPSLVGGSLTATATRDWSGGSLSTSEFSKCIVIERSPLFYLPQSFLHLLFGTMEQMSRRPGWDRNPLSSLLPPVRIAVPAEPKPDEFAGPLLPGDPGTGPDPAEEPARVETPTPTAEPSQAGFSRPQFSTDVVYYGAPTCGPQEVEIEIMGPPEAQSVVVFLRLAEEGGPGRSEWAAEAMTPLGYAMYLYTFQSEGGAVPLGEFAEAMLQTQFVATDAQGNEVGRSEVFSQVMFLPCGAPGILGP